MLHGGYRKYINAFAAQRSNTDGYEIEYREEEEPDDYFYPLTLRSKNPDCPPTPLESVVNGHT